MALLKSRVRVSYRPPFEIRNKIILPHREMGKKLMNIKMMVTNLDSTLMHGDKTISDYTT